MGGYKRLFRGAETGVTLLESNVGGEEGNGQTRYGWGWQILGNEKETERNGRGM